MPDKEENPVAERHRRHEEYFDKLFSRKVGITTFIIVVGLFGGALGYVARDVSGLQAANADQDKEISRQSGVIQGIDDRLKELNNKIDRLIDANRPR